MVFRAPHLPRPIDWKNLRRGRQLNAQVILLDGRDPDTRCVHSYVSAILRRLSSYVTQGSGRPSTGITGTTVSIFWGLDSEARELRVELGGHSCIDRPRSQRTTWKTAWVVDYVIFNLGVYRRMVKPHPLAICNQLLYHHPMPLINNWIGWLRHCGNRNLVHARR